jgi:hypothetical protein
VNGYVLFGYIVVLGAIGGYAFSLVARLRIARQRARSFRDVNERIEP